MNATLKILCVTIFTACFSQFAAAVEEKAQYTGFGGSTTELELLSAPSRDVSITVRICAGRDTFSIIVTGYDKGGKKNRNEVAIEKGLCKIISGNHIYVKHGYRRGARMQYLGTTAK